jgi:UPF0716 protein FxsA
MVYLLFAIFLGIPLVEIALFILIGGQIGVLATIAAVLATAVAGAVLVRQQGLSTLEKAQRELDNERIPAGALAEGLAILLAGALLLTPGFFTDAIGFALLVPPLRRWLVAVGGAWLAPKFTIVMSGSGRGRQRGQPRDGPIIEGQAVEIEDEPTANPNPDSPWRNR